MKEKIGCYHCAPNPSITCDYCLGSGVLDESLPRFDFIQGFGGGEIKKRPDGDYVPFETYEVLRKKNDELKERLSDLRFSVSMKASQYKDEIPAQLYDSLFELTRKYKE